MNLTPPQKRALRILYEHGPLWPREFAKLMWPESLGWHRNHRCGRGTSAGAMMAMVGGGYLAKLYYRGWVKKEWHRRWLADRPRLAGHILTAKGREIAKELEDAA